MDFPGLSARLALVRETVARCQAARGWQHSVRILGVTKTHGPEAVRAAVAAGLQAVGENRVQEALQKQELLGGLSVEWHLIGTLQRNKARNAVGRFTLIHSVDRLDLAAELDRRAITETPQAVLVQVNCSAEPQKGGVSPESLPSFLDEIRQFERLQVRGLMTMSALAGGRSEQRRAFNLLRELRDAGMRGGHSLPELSMGMSGDYDVAVEEIRLGTLLFGERSP
jgi:pyridoxal phosphate enzyme (YggS family)